MEELFELDTNFFKQIYFDELEKRNIYMVGDIDEDTIYKVAAPLLRFNSDKSQTPVNLYIHSYGGSVDASLVICNIIDSYSKPLNIIVLGMACSAATIMLCAGSKNPNVKKYCYPFSYGLIHSGMTHLAGETASVEDVMNFNKRLDEQTKKYIVENTAITSEMYDEHYRKQWFLDAQTLVDFKMVDKIL